jgi:hypothetical protein
MTQQRTLACSTTASTAASLYYVYATHEAGTD